MASTKSKSSRPKGITDEHLEYLDDLRDSGITNMYGASEYVEDAFGTSKAESKKILMYWMKSFGDENR